MKKKGMKNGKKKNVCSRKFAGLLPSCVTIQWQLYRDMVGWKADLLGCNKLRCIVDERGFGWLGVSRYSWVYRDMGTREQEALGHNALAVS